MTNNKQQTAVEFIIDLIQKRIDRNFERCVQGLPDDHCRGYLYKLLEECNEAKEMEKNQIMDANEDLSTANGLQYYNQTFGDESNP
jgi:hypothetical protein